MHNKYKIRGGEDTVCENEAELLSSNGHTVKVEYFNNAKIRSLSSQIITALLSVFNPFSAFKIWLIIRAFKPDIIHVHNFFPLISPSIFWLSKLMKIPIVFTLHNFRLICANGLLFVKGKQCKKCSRRLFQFPSLYNRCYRNSVIQTFSCSLMNWINILIGTWKNVSPKFIVLSDFAKDLFLENAPWLMPEKFEVKPNFSHDFGVGEKDREDYYLYIGRLSEEKGIEVLINSLRFHSKNIIVVGDGPLRGFVEDSMNIYPNSRYEGSKSKQQCIEYMKKCKALLFPSIWVENFPMTIIEALSTGTPIIYSMTGPLTSIIPEGIAGLGYDKILDPEALSNAINKFDKLTNKTDYYRNARNTYEEKYTPQINIRLLNEIYAKNIKEEKTKN